MKELSIEEKAKAYDEALKYAMIYYKNGNEDMKTMMKTCFPVLVEESEDERIRKDIVFYIAAHHKDDGEKARWLAWLEKQGESKEYTFKSLPRLFNMIELTNKAKTYCQKLIDALVKEGYTTDAKILGECLKAMNGENVPMAIMDEKQGEQKQKMEEQQ